MSRARDFADLAGSADAGGLTGRNLIINGAMQVWQRGTGSTAVGSTNTYHADRWLAREDSDGSLTTEQSTDAPANFKYSNKVTVTSADTSIGAAQKCYFSQRVEGTVFDSLGFGTSAAKTTTLSFYVKSSLTGTFSGSLTNDNNNRSYPYEYTISSANTWERKSVTFPGDTTGTWDTGSSDWLELYWDLGIGSNFEGSAGAWVAAQDFGTSGSTKLIGTNGATWLISGVQWERGETATPFEHRSFGDELARCQRYYYRLESSADFTNFAVLRTYSTTKGTGTIYAPVSMRSVPTATNSAASNFSYSLSALSPIANYTQNHPQVFTVDATGAFTANGAASLENGTGSGAGIFIAYDAEL